jgi:hypothetical protein
MIVFKEWLQKLRAHLTERGYRGDITGFIFESTARQDYDLGLPPDKSAKIFIEEWTP